MAVHKKFNALGRGLDALISTEEVSTQGSSTINEISIDQIEANPNQPRREFDPEALQELANSIQQIGIIQPITLRQISENRFQIIAGERRWRASRAANKTTIPAIVLDLNEKEVKVFLDQTITTSINMIFPQICEKFHEIAQSFK